MSTETRGRLRFKDFSIERLSSGQCQARVVLAWPGEATGLSSQAGQLRWAAQACLSALATAFPEVAFDLVGVKAVRAFDATVVIASLAPPMAGSMDPGWWGRPWSRIMFPGALPWPCSTPRTA